MIELDVRYQERIDKYIADNTDLSRNDVKELLKLEAVYINGDTLVHKGSYLVKEGWKIKIVKLLEKETDIKPVDMPIDVAYEDDDLIIINKPSGLVVHPAPGHLNDTLVNGLLYHFKNHLSNQNGLLRPGVIHRIDKDTSGLLIIAKNNEMHIKLAALLKEHKIKRTYLAIATGVIENKITKINLPIERDAVNRKVMKIDREGKDAVTYVHLLKHFYIDQKPYSLVKCELETGRTHQIRVHLAYIKHPVYGDPVYGKAIDSYNQRLHAYKLEFVHPITNKNIVVYAPIPKEFDVADYDYKTLYAK